MLYDPGFLRSEVAILACDLLSDVLGERTELPIVTAAVAKVMSENSEGYRSIILWKLDVLLGARMQI